jgi:hypothetical protein
MGVSLKKEVSLTKNLWRFKNNGSMIVKILRTVKMMMMMETLVLMKVRLLYNNLKERIILIRQLIKEMRLKGLTEKIKLFIPELAFQNFS